MCMYVGRPRDRRGSGDVCSSMVAASHSHCTLACYIHKIAPPYGYRTSRGQDQPREFRAAAIFPAVPVAVRIAGGIGAALARRWAHLRRPLFEVGQA